MTDTRLAALEAVAKAAKTVVRVVNAGLFEQQDGADAFDAMEDALRALRALPAPQPVEKVTLAVWALKDGEALFTVAASDMDLMRRGSPNWRRLGTVTLAIDPEAPK